MSFPNWLNALPTMTTPTTARTRARALVAIPAIAVCLLVASPRRVRAKPTRARIRPITPRVPAIQNVSGIRPNRQPTTPRVCAPAVSAGDPDRERDQAEQTADDSEDEADQAEPIPGRARLGRWGVGRGQGHA